MHLGDSFQQLGNWVNAFYCQGGVRLGRLTGSTYLVRASHSFSWEELGSRPMDHCWGTPGILDPSGSLVEGLKVREDASTDSFLLLSRLQAQGRWSGGDTKH